MTDKLSQKEAVYEAIQACRDDSGNINKENTVSCLLVMYERGLFEIKSEVKRSTDESKRSYIRSVVSNWIKKDKRLIGNSVSQEETQPNSESSKMQVQGGIFPTRVVINNCSYKDQDWLRNIDLIIFRFPVRRKDGSYDINLVDFSTRIKDSLNPSGWCVVFAYGSIENKLRPFEFASELKNVGLNLVDVISVNRPWWGGKRSDTHLALSHEYVFLFSKSSKWYLDRTPIYSQLSGDKYDGATCPGNSWDLKGYNPAENYSPELACAIMKMVCLLPGSVVMDPFMGGKSGIEAASTCGHSFIGFESDKGRYDKYSKVLEKVQKRIENRDNDHSKGDDGE